MIIIMVMMSIMMSIIRQVNKYAIVFKSTSPFLTCARWSAKVHPAPELTRCKQFGKQLRCTPGKTTPLKFNTQGIHVWQIYIHLVDSYGKCRYIYHTWILWDMEPENNGCQKGISFSMGSFSASMLNFRGVT